MRVTRIKRSFLSAASMWVHVSKVCTNGTKVDQGEQQQPNQRDPHGHDETPVPLQHPSKSGLEVGAGGAPAAPASTAHPATPGAADLPVGSSAAAPERGMSESEWQNIRRECALKHQDHAPALPQQPSTSSLTRHHPGNAGHHPDCDGFPY